MILAFDTANEYLAVGVGRLDVANRRISVLASYEQEAFRASNTKLIESINRALEMAGVSFSQIECIICGRGPGSFTGVRICLATAKGLALGAGLPLFGVSTLDAQAWELWDRGVRGPVAIVGDAMRKEVYPARCYLRDEGIDRRDADTVIKADQALVWLGLDTGGEANASSVAPAGSPSATSASPAQLVVSGDALTKYADLFADKATLTPSDAWHPTGKGLLLATQAAWQQSQLDPYDAVAGNPCTLLPVYTRLSDAEEHERLRFAQTSTKDLVSGVQGVRVSGISDNHEPPAHPHNTAAAIRFLPLDRAWTAAVAQLEQAVMGSDAWNEAQVADELPRSDRSWWAAYEMRDSLRRLPQPGEDRLVGYAGGWIVDGTLHVLKVATDPALRRSGIARELVAHLAADARDLGAREATLEVRTSNTAAQAFYEALGLQRIGVRPHYYSDREDACIYTGPLPVESGRAAGQDVAGMHLRINETAGNAAHADTHTPATRDTVLADALPTAEQLTATVPLSAQPTGTPASAIPTLILALETSCDETAAAIVDGEGAIVADVVASQIDFHARFGGVVPEIASRKHIEAIGGVVEECMEQARRVLNLPNLTYANLAAVGVTCAPGLVGALVVGLAFAKGLAYACNLPLIGVNHLEGHIYANKLEHPDITPPFVASLVSGGHTMLVHVKDWGSYTTLGTTLDDAVGEAFDKVAKALGLGYPGGPIISRLAAEGNPKAIRFPRALLHSGDLQFSLSGLKTSVMTYIQKEQAQGRALNVPDIAASFQAAVVDVQVSKAKAALEQTGAPEFCLGGGVAANPALRQAYEDMCAQMGVRLTLPPLSACTDNAAMIALVALDAYRDQRFIGFDADVSAHAPLDEIGSDAAG